MTDSLGSRGSDHSGGCSVINVPTRPFARMDVACVVDLQEADCLSQRRRAFEDVKGACHALGANFHHLQVGILHGFPLAPAVFTYIFVKYSIVSIVAIFLNI